LRESGILLSRQAAAVLLRRNRYLEGLMNRPSSAMINVRMSLVERKAASSIRFLQSFLVASYSCFLLLRLVR
jgi:hypothetical protein